MQKSGVNKRGDRIRNRARESGAHDGGIADISISEDTRLLSERHPTRETRETTADGPPAF